MSFVKHEFEYRFWYGVLELLKFVVQYRDLLVLFLIALVMIFYTQKALYTIYSAETIRDA